MVGCLKKIVGATNSPAVMELLNEYPRIIERMGCPISMEKGSASTEQTVNGITLKGRGEEGCEIM